MLTSRRTVLIGAGGAATLAVAGCGGSGSAGAGGAPGTSGFPVTVPGKLGPTTVPRRPDRVLSCGYLRDTDLALALGANLVGLVKNDSFVGGLAPWQRPTTHPTLLTKVGGLPLETIAGLRPDLILASDDYSLPMDNAELSRIAPVLGYLNGVGADSWQDMARRAGTVLGAPDRAEQLVGQVQQKIASIRAAHPEFAGRTFTTGPVTADGTIYTTSSPGDALAVLYGELGLRLSPTVTSLPPSSTAGRSIVSPERLDLLDADVMLVGFPSQAVRATFEANPLFQRLPAVRRGSYVPTLRSGPDLGPGIALAFPSVLSIPFGLDAVVPEIAGALARR